MFLGGCVGLVFFPLVFANVFALFFGVSLPKLFGKILLMSGLVFSGFVLSSLGFSPTSSSFSVFLFCFFSRDTDQVVTGHPFTRTCLFGSFLFCVPPLLSVPPVWAVRPASWRFSGVPFWAPGVFGILRGPSEALSWDARRQGFSCSSSALFSFSPFCFAATPFLERPGVVSLTRRVLLPTPRRSDSQGKAPSLGRGL